MFDGTTPSESMKLSVLVWSAIAQAFSIGTIVFSSVARSMPVNSETRLRATMRLARLSTLTKPEYLAIRLKKSLSTLVMPAMDRTLGNMSP